MLDEILSEKLVETADKWLLRRLRLINSAPSAHIVIGAKKFINFSSNNYLDLAGNKEINKAAGQAVEKYGFGGVSSRLVGGNLEIHKKLEKELAKFKGKQSSLVFASGYQANVGLISALGAIKDTCIIMDKLNHASLWDGTKLSGARIFVYDHCDMNSLKKVLKRAHGYKLKLVVTESVFSMDGDLAPLHDFTDLCQKYGAVSIVDEAHATGVFGKEGRGLAHLTGVSDKVDVIIGTLSKAFAVQGGFICGSQNLIHYLVNKSRAFIYSTAVSPAVCAAALKSLEMIKKADTQRKHLHKISEYLKEKLKEKDIAVSNSQSQIIPVITGEEQYTVKLSKKLFSHGIFAPAIRFPTVPEGQARIRISLTAGHNEADIEKLLEVLS